MNDTTHIYQKKKAMSKFFCDEVIRYFDNNIKNHRDGCVGLDGEIIINRAHKNSVDFMLNMHDPLYPINTTLEIILSKNIQEYTKLYPFLGAKGLPLKISESANIQKYHPTGGYTVEHCEYGIRGIYSKRVLAWMFYLNDVTDQGGTRFPRYNLTLKARAGDLYIWPAYFTHSHMGVPSPTQTKYIVTGWVEFIDI
tara:strand:- start:2630 stop:3217 length:588 start_codon:yes stop_codon:yes gene_type:complete